MLAGPNGAGKSNLFETRIAPSLALPFINADIIQLEELKDKNVSAAYDAAGIAAKRRDDFLKNRKSFATESVFSHPSKLEFIQKAKGAGYQILFFHISVANSDLSVARVSERVKEGGHHVPEEKIHARYNRNGPLIRQAVLISDIAHIYDNSKLNLPPERIMTFTNGNLSFVIEQLPDWAYQIYRSDLKFTS